MKTRTKNTVIGDDGLYAARLAKMRLTVFPHDEPRRMADMELSAEDKRRLAGRMQLREFD